MRGSAILLIFVLLSSSVFAAELSGTIYDSNLNVASNVLITINTTPEQRFLAKEGTYAFDLSPGIYEIKANYYEANETLTSTEYVSVKDEGKFIFDLFLFPDLDAAVLEPDLNLSLEEVIPEDPAPSTIWDVLYRLLIVVLLFGFFYIVWKQVSKRTLDDLEDALSEQVIAIIKRNGGRIAQKELRKELPQSEAKISLLITELVEKDRLEKIKKGRSNILILKK